MTDPTLFLRAGESGAIVRGTPGHVLAFDASGERVSGVPLPSSSPVRLPGTAYVDASNPQPAPNGSAANPFTTITAACAALAVDAVMVSSVLVWPGDYSGEAPIAWAGGDNVLFAPANGVSRMWQSSIALARLPDITFAFAASQFVGLNVGVVTDTAGLGVTLVDAETRAGKSVSSANGTVMLDNTAQEFGSLIDAGGIRWRDCEIGGGTYTISGGSMVMQNCIFEGQPTLVSTALGPAALTIDGWSKALLAVLAPVMTNIAYDLQNALA